MNAMARGAFMNRQDFRFFHRMRVRWAEVDMQKIVFNAHYLMYFDTAMADYWRAVALPYEEAMHQLGGDLYVKKATVEFHASARYDDQIDVGMKCTRIGNSSMVFSGGIFRGEELLITGELIYVFADPATQTSKPVPPVLRETLLGYEAGEEVVSVKLGGWDALGTGCRAHPHPGVCGGTAHSDGDGMGRGRRHCRCMRWPTTGWASPWPPAGCCRLSRALPRWAAWRCTGFCAVRIWGGTCCRR
jgi:YbgC/YbaW family acyl-CoA thioester hydrolase